MHQEGATGGRFDVAALAATLPGTAATPLADRYITDRPSGSAHLHGPQRGRAGCRLRRVA